MKRFAISCLGMLVSYGALAAGCDWATETPPDDAKYKYFVAKSYSDSSASDAANKAERDIDAQLGRLFGTRLDVQSEFYSDATNADGTTRSYERTIGIITLKGLERQKGDTQKISGGWTGCVQYRYLKTEIAKERERLNSLPAAALNQPTTFTEVAGDTQCKGAPVEIVTVPAGAYVTLDNGKYQGSAPIKFGNVCNGKYSLEITKENYVPVTQQLIVPTNGRISKTLKRDSKRITVRTSLKNSQIEINGIDKGKEPVTFNAPLGIEQTITAINSEAVKITRMRTFSKDSDPEYIISMEKLPGKIDFSAFKVRNPDVQITVNGAKLNGDVSTELSPDIKHSIKLSKTDYVSIYETVSIQGGKTTYYQSEPREFSTDNSNWSQGRLGLTGLAFIGETYSNNEFGLNAGVELGLKQRLNKTFGFRGGVGLQWQEINIGKSRLDYDVYKYEFNALPSSKGCPDGQTCEYKIFHQYTSSGGYNDAFWGYFSKEPAVSSQSQKFSWEYNEPFYANLGIILWDDFYIYGAGTLGFIKGTASADGGHVPAASMSAKSAVVRFGGGIQWNFCKFVGIRLQYLTSGGKKTLPYEFDNSMHYIGTDARESNQDDYVWLYRGKAKNVSGNTTIDAIESVSLSLFIGF